MSIKNANANQVLWAYCDIIRTVSDKLSSELLDIISDFETCRNKNSAYDLLNHMFAIINPYFAITINGITQHLPYSQYDKNHHAIKAIRYLHRIWYNIIRSNYLYTIPMILSEVVKASDLSKKKTKTIE